MDPLSSAVISSAVGKTNLSLLTALFNFRRSTQIRTCPDFLGAGTMGAHHSVGSVTFSMTPSASILSSSSLTGFMRGMVLTVWTA